MCFNILKHAVGQASSKLLNYIEEVCNMAKKLTEFILTSGQITGHSKVDKDGNFNFWNFESMSKQGMKIGYGSFHTQIVQALKVEDSIEKGCLIRVKIEIFEKPEAVDLSSGKGNEF